MANQPEFRAVVKIAEKRWRDVGAAWVKEKGNLSVQLNTMPIPKGGKANFLLVPNETTESE